MHDNYVKAISLVN